jgi:hypothetical protein
MSFMAARATAAGPLEVPCSCTSTTLSENKQPREVQKIKNK